MEKGSTVLGTKVLSGVSLPAAIIRDEALTHNLAWMQAFAERHGAELAPHGKTTMTPVLFERQLAQGAWGITLATAVQCQAAAAHGVTRLLMANQLVGEANMAIVASLIADGVDFYCVVDSAENVAQLDGFFAARGLTLQVLIEFGVPGGRCGCRSAEEVLALAEVIHEAPALALAGLEGYEGVVEAVDPAQGVRRYADTLVEVARTLHEQGRFTVAAPLVTASGSAWYDVIAESFHAAKLTGRLTPVLRPGCYVVHDHGLYREAQAAVLARRGDLTSALEPALEVLAQVQSLPEPGLAIVALGKRDIGYDHLPFPLRRYREGGTANQILSTEGWTLTKLMDQHAFVQLPRDTQDVAIGDIIAFSVSHPCLTFDKWRQLLLVDEALDVKACLSTCF
nr:amino acid deaminase [Halomonas malpeensis]